MIKFMFRVGNMELIKKMKKTKTTHHFDMYSPGLFFFFFLSVFLYSNWEHTIILLCDLLPPPFPYS